MWKTLQRSRSTAGGPSTLPTQLLVHTPSPSLCSLSSCRWSSYCIHRNSPIPRSNCTRVSPTTLGGTFLRKITSKTDINGDHRHRPNQFNISCSHRSLHSSLLIAHPNLHLLSSRTFGSRSRKNEEDHEDEMDEDEDEDEDDDEYDEIDDTPPTGGASTKSTRRSSSSLSRNVHVDLDDDKPLDLPTSYPSTFTQPPPASTPKYVPPPPVASPSIPPPSDLDVLLDSKDDSTLFTDPNEQFTDALQIPQSNSSSASSTKRPKRSFVSSAASSSSLTESDLNRFHRPPTQAFDNSPYAQGGASNTPLHDDPYNSSFNSFAPNSTFVSSHYRIDPQTVLKYIGERKHLTYVRVGTDRINIRDCPFCRKPTHNKPDNQWKLTVWLDTGSHHCFRCGAKGSWFDFKRKLGDIPNITNVMGSKIDQNRNYGQHFQQVAEGKLNDPSAAASNGSQSKSSTSSSKLPSSNPLPIQSIVHQYPNNLMTNPKYESVLDYLQRVRGLTLATLHHYQIGGCVHRFPNPAKNHLFEEQICITMPWIKTKAQLDEIKNQMEGKDDMKKKEKEKDSPPAGSRKSKLKKSPSPLTTEASATVISSTPVQTHTPAGSTASSANTNLNSGGSTPSSSSSSKTPFPPHAFDQQVTERIKLRSLTSKGNQRLLPSGGRWNFFGWHTVPLDAEEIVITEGEFDAMACYQATGLPSVSLPNGARSLPVELLPLLEKFKRIYLWLDDDAAGVEGAEKFARKLGLGRCLIVKSSLPARRHSEEEYDEEHVQHHGTRTEKDRTESSTSTKPPKDANDALRQGIDLRALIAHAAPLRHEQILQFADIRNEVLREFTDPLARRGVQSRYLPGLNRLLKGHRPGELTIVTGATGVGKCWGKGTQICMYDGQLKKVEDVCANDLLMGDDLQPRRVQPGSLTRGNTDKDLQLYIDSLSASPPPLTSHPSPLPATLPATWRVEFPFETGLDSWTCNGDHILVLKMAIPPSKIVEETSHGRAIWKHQVWQLVETIDGNVQPMEVTLSQTYSSYDEANLALIPVTSPVDHFEWECTVNQFMSYPTELCRRSRMFTAPSGVIQFPPSTLGESLIDRFQRFLIEVGHSTILLTDSTLSIGVWLLGAELARTFTTSVDDRLINERCRAWTSQIGAMNIDANLGCDVIRRFIESYGAPSNILTAIFRESVHFRTTFLTGLLDASHQTSATSHALLDDSFDTPRSLTLLDKGNDDTPRGIIRLARSIGAVVTVAKTDDHHLNAGIIISIRILKDSSSSSIPPSSSVLSHHPFTITRVAHADYYGFTLTSVGSDKPTNGRLLLGDLIVSHNTTVLSQISLDYCSQGVNTLWGSFEIRNTKLARTMISQYANMNFSTEIPSNAQSIPQPPDGPTDPSSTAIEMGMDSEPLVPQPITSPPPDPNMIRQFNMWADRFEQLPLYFMKFFGSNTVETVLDAMEYAVYVYDVEHILLDNLQFMLSEQASRGSGAYDRFELQDRAIALFRQFASVKNVHITLVIHPKKEHDSHALGVSSIFGGAKATQEADNILIIQKPVAVDENLLLGGGGGGGYASELSRLKAELDMARAGHGANEDASFISQHRRIEVKKNRFDGELGTIPFKYDKRTCRIYEITGGSKRPSSEGNSNGNGGGSLRRASPVARSARPTRATTFGASGVIDQTAKDAAIAQEKANQAAAASMMPKVTPNRPTKSEPKPVIMHEQINTTALLNEFDAPDNGLDPSIKKTRKKSTSKKDEVSLDSHPSSPPIATDVQPHSTNPPTVESKPKKKRSTKPSQGGTAAGAPIQLTPPIEVVVD